MPAEGSSPHTRGAQDLDKAISGLWRIIPAYAGSTIRTWTPPRDPADHPRIRGEHEARHPVAASDAGSSPHTRGAREKRHIFYRHVGIIPAYAGSTSTLAPPTVSLRDHPRIRGEHRNESRGEQYIVGSSPHTRGALMISMCGAGTRGIIPAYAGSTIRAKAYDPNRRDHPRIRGEHPLFDHERSRREGSSPHTRGARVVVEKPVVVRGIIPAYAGSTVPTERSRYFRGGSSPHTRGARHRHPRPARRERIIPAYAGSTVAEIFKFPDHPGSSPHTRGAPRPLLPLPLGSRIIPAYAGSTHLR